MRWHLKDRELEHKLIEIDADFSENLNRTCESLDTNKDGDFCNYQQVRVNLRHDSKLFTVVFLGSDVESVHNYNAGGWNHWPETKPEECVLMEIRKDGKDETHGFLFFLGNTWYHAMGLTSLALSDEKFRYRPAKLFFEEQRINERE